MTSEYHGDQITGQTVYAETPRVTAARREAALNKRKAAAFDWLVEQLIAEAVARAEADAANRSIHQNYWEELVKRRSPDALQ